MRDNIILQYTVFTFLVTALVAGTLGWALSRQNTQHLIYTHSSVFPSSIRVIVKDHPEFLSFLQSPPGTEMPPNARAFLDDLLSFESIFRIKVWGRDGTILWSDQPELIGQNFSANPHFRSAMAGMISWEFGKPKKSENRYEQKENLVLEIYTPIEESGQRLGVLELYESDQHLEQRITVNTRIIWTMTGTASLVLYGLLFLVFYRAHLKQKKTDEQLLETQDVIIFAMANQAELRDRETGRHLERTANYARLLAESLKNDPRYRGYLTQRYIEDLVKSTPLHDIGKVGIPDSILRKPGRLSEEEFEEMKRHTEFGASILKRAEEKIPFQTFLQIAIQITGNHHEKWDGSGYPQGLRGENIPLSARIMALPDVYDALRSSRPYKPALSHEECAAIIREESGKHFDPAVVKAFFQQEFKFKSISEQLAD